MKKTRIILCFLLLLVSTILRAQQRTVQNRPYTDLRPLHFGVVVGTHFQDLELNNLGPVTIMNEDGTTTESYVSVDQDRWDPGFQVGVLGEMRLGTYLALRIAPMMYFGSRHLTFHNYNDLDDSGVPSEVRQNAKSVYVAGVVDLIFSSKRSDNHRPYLVAGVTPMLNLVSKNNDYIQLNKSDVFVNVGLGCDFYLPYFKLRPEFRFMYGLTNSYNSSRAASLKDDSMKPYAMSVDKTRSKMICLSFYFE